MMAAGSRRSASASAARSARRSTNSPVTPDTSGPYHTFWYGPSVSQHHRQELLAAADGMGAGLRARQMQEPDSGGERGIGPHVGFAGIETVVEKGLPDRLEHPPIRAAHRRGDALLRARPFAHRT